MTERIIAAEPVDHKSPAHPPGRGIALAVILACQLMVILDATVVSIALPDIRGDLHFSPTSLAWVLNAYTLAFGGLLLLGGRAGDILGRRRVLVAGIVVFTVASLLGGIATSAGLLVAARVLQGVGAALAAPSTLALITTNFPEGPERNRAIALYSAVSGSGAALGLIAGGLLTDAASWRWVLFINLPIGAAAVVLAPRYIQESERHPGRFDLAGALTSTAGMAALVYGFIRSPPTAGAMGSRSPRSVWPPRCWPRSLSWSRGPGSPSRRCGCSPTATGPGASSPCCSSLPPCSACFSS